MKKFIFILVLILFAQSVQSEEKPALRENADVQDVKLDMRDYDGIEIPAGTFIPVINTQEISSQYCEEGYKVKFIVTNDLYMNETNIIPKESVIYGYVENLHAPVVGTDASMKIRIANLVYPDGVELPIKGYLYNANNNMFGGGMSEPVKYIKMAQRQQKVHRTTLQIKPAQGRKMGVNVIIPSGSSEIVVLTAPVQITHTLTN